MKHGHTPGISFTNKHIAQDTRTDNITYQLWDSRLITHCDRAGKGLFHMSGEGGGPTHISTTRTGITSAYTYSTLPLQKGRYLLRRRAYRKEKTKDYLIVSEPCNASTALCVPHVFFPDQAYLSLYRDKSSGEQS